ncbi:PLxRFG domain-containing protein [Sesbania bispinosa]|nr:PLxRFG domain-containing protein [Sesbania bispinosa]
MGGERNTQWWRRRMKRLQVEENEHRRRGTVQIEDQQRKRAKENQTSRSQVEGD